MKKCPYCAEEIQDGAIVCQYCGRAVPAADLQRPNEAKDNPDHSLGWFAYALIGLIVAVLALVWGLARNTQVSQPFTQRLASLTRISTPTPQPHCFGWYQITPEMRGQPVCVYGMVLDYEENWAYQRTYIYFGSKEEFFLVSDFRWSASVEDTCITAEGIVELNTYETPYIEVVDIHDCK